MSDKFDHQKIEAKWQKRWQKEGTYSTPEGGKKRYVLDMFPYPSGSSMHVGHLEGYVGTDILSRYLRMNGYSVLHPMGWDAFGLPAENYAIKTGIHPDKSTHENIKTFKRQLEISGLSYDWSREIDTSSPEFCKWNQWLFILLYKKGLAYKKKAPVNWCPKDETVLANEQVVDGKCERCDTPVVQKELDQWFFKITAYADRLISGLDKIDWPEEVKRQQINWIGKGKGLDVDYKIEGADLKITVWTKFWETVFGTTFLVLAPEHDLLKQLKLPQENKEDVEKYIKTSLSKSNEERKEAKEKTGVFTGLYATNQVNGQKVPIWIADYVLTDVGTGAVMGVPAHDERDFDFAKKYHLDIVQVVSYADQEIDRKVKNAEISFEGEGELVNSGRFDGMDAWGEGKKKMAEWMIKEGFANWRTTYHLRDWLISRQRYWGCPIPMIYCDSCASKGITFKDPVLQGMAGWFPVEEKDLPVLLPADVGFLPHGESPITRSKSFQKEVKCPKCGKTATREVDTMDGYVDSSWYFIRFADPNNKKEFASPENLKKWLPVDDYVGGGHIVQHLLFARFFWKVLFDAGLIEKSLGEEPFLKLRAPGWILGEDSRKMSKRWGNVVTPDDIIPKFGADTLRVYEMFMGPFDVMKPWSMTGVEGASRFLGRVWRLFSEKRKAKSEKGESAVTTQNLILSKLHQTIKKVGEDIENYKFNTAISSLMELVNVFSEYRVSNHEYLGVLARLLAPFAPHMMEEIWVEYLHQPFSIHKAPWPSYEAKHTIQSKATVVIQVNGKTRGILNLESGISNLENEVTEIAKKDEKIGKWIEGKLIKKTIFVPGKLINFVL